MDESICVFRSDIAQKISVRQSDVESTHRTRTELHREWERNVRQDLEALQGRIAVNQSQIIAMEQRRDDLDALREQSGPIKSPDLESLQSEQKSLHRAKMAKIAAHGTRVSEASAAFGAGSFVMAGISVGIAAAPLLAACIVM
jgi:hypothetical protein